MLVKFGMESYCPKKHIYMHIINITYIFDNYNI